MKWIKILFNFFIDIITEVALHIFILPLGISYYFLCLKQKGQITVVLCNHIGDIVYTLAAIPPLNNKYGKTTLVLEKKWDTLLSSFEINADIKHISPFWRWAVFCANKTVVGQRIMFYSNSVKIVNTGDYFSLGYEITRRIPNLTLLDCVHRIALGLDNTYDIQLSKKATDKCNIERLIQENELKKGMSVILTPMAHSVQVINQNFWKSLARKLSSLGYKVFTNISSEQESAIEGTTPLLCSLGEIIDIAKYCGYVIGVRNGLMDLISLSSCQIIALYNADDVMRDFFDITQNNKNNPYTCQYKLTENEILDIDAVITLMTKDN